MRDKVKIDREQAIDKINKTLTVLDDVKISKIYFYVMRLFIKGE